MPTCEIDGYWEVDYGREHYRHCEEVAITVVDGLRVCRKHAEEA